MRLSLNAVLFAILWNQIARSQELLSDGVNPFVAHPFRAE